MVRLVNAHRQANGLVTYKELGSLDECADKWSEHMAEGGFCEHVDANGKSSREIYTLL